jgi:hypothetical protein
MRRNRRLFQQNRPNSDIALEMKEAANWSGLPSEPLCLFGHLPPVVGGLAKHPFGFRVFGFIGQLIALGSAGLKLVCLAHPNPRESNDTTSDGANCFRRPANWGGP